MTDNVISFRGISSLDLNPNRVLQEAINDDLQYVVIMGFRKDGSEYFKTSVADGGDVLWIMERSKLKLLRTVDE